ncbi:cupin domain-containing protein [Geminicoccus flavidas]|uniref:cupin domain-containing protein n=1 Tax=Geminicoccus flavidas TaxID=2506407 RepID=UPI00135BA364|nr:dimethylsulfonioproprionate lyase family protein [Geminicoccus flavidas]
MSGHERVRHAPGALQGDVGAGGTTGTVIDLRDLGWETWQDPELKAESAVQWKLVFSAGRTPTGAISMGLAEIAPDGVLPLHRHEPAEVYHVLEGRGQVEIESAVHELYPGRLVFIPPGARHRTSSAGSSPLRFLFIFPTNSFEEVVYQFED